MQPLFSTVGLHPRNSFQRWQEILLGRLTDPACTHRPIGLLAYGSGFASQAHCARRFKERHSLSPREYRHAALQPSPA
jgi:AraC family transcriptional regulator, positive regulator of tynA and feaB